MSLFAELNELMLKYRFRPEKKFSQHFLVNEDMLKKIIKAAELKKTEVILEIGCGTGFLTRELAKHAKKVIGIENDSRFIKLLQNELKAKNFELLEGDALQLKWPSFSKMVALPPYSISSGLVHKLLSCDFESVFLVFQREFAEKLVAEPGFLEYNALTVLTQYHTKPKLLFLVSNTCFFPKPPCFSVLVELKKNKRFGSAKNNAAFEAFVKQLFRHKKKSVSNALKLALPFLKKELKISFEKCRQKAGTWKHWNEKVYALPIKQFVELFNWLFV